MTVGRCSAGAAVIRRGMKVYNSDRRAPKFYLSHTKELIKSALAARRAAVSGHSLLPAARVVLLTARHHQGCLDVGDFDASLRGAMDRRARLNTPMNPSISCAFSRCRSSSPALKDTYLSWLRTAGRRPAQYISETWCFAAFNSAPLKAFLAWKAAVLGHACGVQNQ